MLSYLYALSSVRGGLNKQASEFRNGRKPCTDTKYRFMCTVYIKDTFGTFG